MILLNKIKNINQEACVSLILNTHRTSPDNQKDEIKLKNLVNEVENRLLASYDKRLVWPIMENLNKAVNSIDHNANLESLVIYANTDFSDYTRLPVEVIDRVSIDATFVTRDLIRAMHNESAYYVLVLGRKNARLIEAYAGKVVQELSGKFPMTNSLYTTDKEKLTNNKGKDNLTEEFFNRVDKNVLAAIKDHNLPILLVTESRNFTHYKKMADKKEFIMGHLNGNRDNEKANKLVLDAWKVVLPFIKEKNAARLGELKKAISERKFYSDINDIWKSIQQGKGKTLFVKRGFFQPVLKEEKHFEITDSNSQKLPNYMDDIVDEMIEQTMAFGGDIVFVEGDELEKFNNIALLNRY